MNDAATAIEAIDEWSVTACGDFCSRWQELRNAVLVEPTHWLFEGWHEDIEQLIEKEESAIHVGSMLVPSGIADVWETAAILKSRFLAMGRQYGPSVFQGEEGIQRLVDGMGMDDEVMYEGSLSAVETMAVLRPDHAHRGSTRFADCAHQTPRRSRRANDSARDPSGWDRLRIGVRP